MSNDDAGYFFVLNQVEQDLEIDHDNLLHATRAGLDKALELWFNMRSVITQRFKEPSEGLKQGVWEVKQLVRELEEE